MLTKVRNVLDITVDTVGDLQTCMHRKGSVQVLGYHTRGDGGGGVFYWDEDSTVPDDGGTVLQVVDTPTGRWLREYSGVPLEEYFGRAGEYKLGGVPNSVSNTDRHIVAGIDSLTDGSGGSSYLTYLAGTIRKALGYGGGYIGFDYTRSTKEGVSFVQSGFTYISINTTLPEAKYSFDYAGLVATSFVSDNTIDWDILRQWKTQEIFYLQQPGGATFKVGHTSINNAQWTTTVNTDGELSLQSIVIDVVEGATSGISFKHVSDGKLALFGTLIDLDNAQAKVTQQAFGGFKLSQYAALDNATQVEWFSKLGVTEYILNGGMNDRHSSTAVEYESDLDTFTGNMSGVSVILLSPNQTSDELSSNLALFREVNRLKCKEHGWLSLSVVDYLGTYAEANTKYMHDGVHPNSLGNKRIAWGVAKDLGIPVLGTADVPEFSGVGDNNSKVHKGTLADTYISELNAGQSQVIHTLGLTNGYPTCVFEIEVLAQRTGTGAVVSTTHWVKVSNATAVNRATSAGLITSKEHYRQTASDAAEHNHSISASVVDNKAEISVTADDLNQILFITTKYRFGNLSVSGKSVYTE